MSEPSQSEARPMAEQATTVISQTETPEAFFEDRERFWHTFMGLVAGAVVIVAITLILMAIFLT
jgi:hypothetical protein